MNNELKKIFNKRTFGLAILFNIYFSLPGFKPVLGQITSLCVYITTSIIFIYSFSIYTKKINNSIWRLLKFFFLYALIINLTIPIFLWNQSFFLSAYPLIVFSGFWLMFGLFIRKRYSITDIENSILIASVIYVCLYMISFFFNIKNVQNDYGVNDSIDTNNLRMFFGNTIIAMFGFLLALNRYIVTHKKMYIYFIIVYSTVIILIQTRQVFGIMVLLVIAYLWRRMNIKQTMVIAILCIIVFIVAKPIFNGILEKTARQNESKETSTLYIRYLEYDFYFNKFNETLIQDVFGNGIPQEGGQLDDYWKKKGPGPVADAGYAGIFNYWGIIGLVLFSILLYQICRVKIPEQHKWIWYSILLIYLLNIMSFAMRDGIIILPLYCAFYLSFYNKKLWRKNMTLQ